MKNYLFLLLMLLPVLGTAQVQEAEIPAEEPKLNSIKLYPFAFVKSRFAISYERALANRWSAQVGVGLVSNDQSNFYNGRDVFGYSADVQLRKYLLANKKPLAGIYAAPHIGFKYIEYDTQLYSFYGPVQGPEYTTYSSALINAGVVMGYQMHILEVVVADVYAGGGYRYTNPDIKNSNFYNQFDLGRNGEYNSTGVYPIIGLQIGVLF